MSAAYPLPRGADGRIIVGPLIDDSALRDDPPAEAPAAPPPPPVAAAAEAPPAAAPIRLQRPRGETPTPIGQLRPGQAAGGQASPAAERWRRIGAWALVLAVFGAMGYALWVSGPAPAAAPTPPSAAVTAPTAEGGAPLAVVTAAPAATLTRAIVVFDAPGGTPVGALEPGRGYTLLDERDGWRQLDVPGSGAVWARAWEMDGEAPPAPTPLPTAVPAPPPVVRPQPARPAQPAPVVVPVGPAVTCLPVVDADNGNRYLGDACGATKEEREARALELLQAAPPPTLQQP